MAVLGDFCLDIYWTLDPRGSEVSVETGLPARAVVRQDFHAGGAANLAANVAALQPAEVRAMGILGSDGHGRELLGLLRRMQIDTDGLVLQEGFHTFAFCKPYLTGEELARFDFGVFNRRTRESDAALLRALRHAFVTADAVILNQQIAGSMPDTAFVNAVNHLIVDSPDRIVLVDSRHLGDRFVGACRKANEAEITGTGTDPARPDLEAVAAYARDIFQRNRRPVFITRGVKGIALYDEGGLSTIPAVRLPQPVDPVGAGDTTSSALACALAAGSNPVEAAEFANLAAAVTVQKLRQTGQASGEEILAMAAAQAASSGRPESDK